MGWGSACAAGEAGGQSGGPAPRMPRVPSNAEPWRYRAPLGARLCDLLCFGRTPTEPRWHSIQGSPSSESLSSLSRWGTSETEEVVDLSSKQDGESFAAGDAIEQIIEKLNSTPRTEDTETSIRSLLDECVRAGGADLRENMALYFATKRALGFGLKRDAVDATIASAAEAHAAEVAAAGPDTTAGGKRPGLVDSNVLPPPSRLAKAPTAVAPAESLIQ